ncbi:MAG: hypothetical protein ACO4CT_05615 [Planctomycetota bacterium]
MEPFHLEHPDAKAWHEAGHALVAHLLGGRVMHVTLEPDDEDQDGEVAVAWPRAAGGLAPLSGRVALAGAVAELVYLGDDPDLDPTTLSAWRGDWDEACRCAAQHEHDPERREALLRAWMADVHDLLAAPGHEELLARIADALDAHGTLDDVLFEDALTV